MFDRLSAELERQRAELSNGESIEILSDCAPKGQITIGAKRNCLLSHAQGTWVAFIDDDDEIHPEYLQSIVGYLDAMYATIDAVGFGGRYYIDGKAERAFRIDHMYHYSDDSQNYYRYFNHLSPVRREIALQIGYPDEMFGEDYDYSMRLKASGLIRHSVYIDKEMYHYKFSFHNSETQNPSTR